MELKDIEKEFFAVSDRLKSYLYRLSANIQDSEDLLHDTFIRVRENFKSFRGQSCISTWIFAIATNLARDNRRVKNRWPIDAQEKCKDAAMSEPKNIAAMMEAFRNQPEKQFEIIEHINYCFTCLSKNLILEQQLVIILKEIYSFKRQEIAFILNKSESTVKRLLLNSRKELQDKYESRCAIINKNGICYQCGELNDTLQGYSDSAEKIRGLGLSRENTQRKNLAQRLTLIEKINPLNGNGARLEDTIMQILRSAINDR